jgi:hypothetical protein
MKARDFAAHAVGANAAEAATVLQFPALLVDV